MNGKTMAIIATVAIAAIAIAAAVVLTSNNGHDNDEKDTNAILTHRLLVMGNVFSDDTLDNKDVTVLQAMVDGKSTMTVSGNTIDLSDPSIKRYGDVDGDGSVKASDVDTLKRIIKGEASTLRYENAKGEITSVDVPINNLLVMFRRVGTTVAMVGASDMVKGFISDMAPGGNYGFLGFKGTNVGSGSEPDYELIKSLNTQYSSTGGVTLIADATGSASNLEEKVGSGIDVIRMPVTEMGKSENGVVTLGYLLAYKNTNHDRIMDRLNEWTEWNDSAKKKIGDAVAKLPESQKKSCIISMWNASASSATMNVRGPGVSEYEYTVQCGGKNLTTGSGGSYSISDFNEYILALDPDIVFAMQQEVFLLKNKISAETTYNELISQLSSNYKGKVGMFSQFFGTGPGYVLSLMYYADALIPELKGAFDISKEYKYFMGTLVGNKELAELTAFVPLGNASGPTVKDVTITDSTGKEVTLKAPVDKLCTVNTNAAEFFQMLGVSDRVVGADNATIKSLDRYKNVVDIGDYKTPSGEKIVSTGANVVISQSSSRSLSEATEQALKDNYGITVLRLDFYGETMHRDVTEFLKLLSSDNAQKAYNEYKTEYDRVVKTVQDKAAAASGDPSFLMLFTSMSKSEGTYYNENSELGKIIESIHGHNALTDMGVTSKTVTSKPSAEAVYDYDQAEKLGYIFIRGVSGNPASADYQTFLETGKSLSGFGSMNVIKNKDVYVIETDVLSGPRDYIGHVCIAEAFGIDTGLDYESLVDAFNKKYGFDTSYTYIMQQFPSA